MEGVSQEVQAGVSMLAQYPLTIWKADSPPDWMEMIQTFEGNCVLMSCVPLKSVNPDRKWEITSAYQKAIRRSDLKVAEKMVNAFLCLPDQLEYFWRRMCVIVAEDIGPANPTLMAFVFACQEQFKPKKTSLETQAEVIGALTAMMVYSKKSRMYCAMNGIENVMAHKFEKGLTDDGEAYVEEKWQHLDPLNEWEVEYISYLQNRPKDLDMTVGLWCWKKGNLAEQLGRYYSTDPDLALRDTPVPEAVSILGIPSYAYDMHTKIGKTCTYRLCGWAVVKEILSKTGVNDKAKAVGYSLFFAEGGRHSPEYWDTNVAFLEMKLHYNSLGMTLADGLDLQDVMLQLIANGELNKLREKIAKQVYEGV